MSGQCLICSGNCYINDAGDDIYYYNCPICSEYFTDWEAKNHGYSFVDSPDKFIKISAFLRYRAVLGLKPLLLLNNDEIVTDKYPSITIKDILKEFPRTISQRIDKTITILSKMSKFTGDFVNINAVDKPIFFPDDIRNEAVFFMMEQLFNTGYIENSHKNHAPTIPIEIRLTAKGWNRIAEIENSVGALSNRAFVAMWFDTELMKVFNEYIYKAIDDAGYEPFIIPMKEHNGDITDEIIAEIKNCKFLVADFTGQRGGVYFEAGFAHGLGKPVIWTCRNDWFNCENKKECDVKIDGKIQKAIITEERHTHFDINHYNFIVWESPEDLYTRLYNRIRATINK